MDKFNQISSENDRLIHDQQEKVKELACINKTSSILKEGKPIKKTLQQIALLLSSIWQYPEYTVARIKYSGKESESVDFKETKWRMVQVFITIYEEKGSIEVYETKQLKTEDEGPFLKEEKALIRNIGKLLAGYINYIKAKVIFSLTRSIQKEGLKSR